MMVRGPNHGRRKARANLPESTPQPPLPVNPAHPCWCQRPDAGLNHTIGAHWEFWAFPPAQGVA